MKKNILIVLASAVGTLGFLFAYQALVHKITWIVIQSM